MTVRRIVSGGQTGVDRAALDAALASGLPCGGWCPQGRLAEDGIIPDRYPLTEAGQRGYRHRTRLNVRDSDGTLILARGSLQGGTAYTARCAEQLGRPLLVVRLDDPGDIEARAASILAWAVTNRTRVLNVAGPRESQHPGIGTAARALMDALCAAIRQSA